MSSILIDVTRLMSRQLKGRLPTGVDRVSLEYLRHFAGRSTALVRFAGQWLELSPNDSERVYAGLLSPAGNVQFLYRRLVAKALFQRLRQRRYPPRILFNTGHSGLEKNQYAQRLQHFKFKPVFFVHDLIPITHPEYCRPGEAAKHHARMRTVLNHAGGVIANSIATQASLAAYASHHALPMPPLVVASLAPPQLLNPASIARLNKPYFVMLGTIEPRKNHWLLLQIWRKLVETLGDQAPRLVVIGQRGWECENVVDLLERCEALQGFVLEVAACSDAQLVTWLQHAQALLFPSFAEGFGMPLVEALSIGLPVIASDLPVFREIAGNIPEYLHPLDGMGWQRLIMAYADSAHPLRCAQLQRLSQFAAPTWAAHFKQVEILLERIHEQSS